MAVERRLRRIRTRRTFAANAGTRSSAGSTGLPAGAAGALVAVVESLVVEHIGQLPQIGPPGGAVARFGGRARGALDRR